MSANDFHELGERSEVPFHRVYRLDDHQAPADRRSASEDLLEVSQIVVRESPHRRARQHSAVVERPMGVAIEDYQVSGTEEGGDHGHVGRIAARIGDGPRCAHERRQTLLEVPVHACRPAEHARSAGVRAVVLDGGDARRLHARVVPQPQVAVGGQVDDGQPRIGDLVELRSSGRTKGSSLTDRSEVLPVVDRGKGRRTERHELRQGLEKTRRTPDKIMRPDIRAGRTGQ